MVTMKDVALRAGVSMSTVSYALSGTRPISDETRQRIHAAMAELGFEPNLHARALASRRSRILALLMPPKKRGLGISELEIIQAATESARARAYNVMLWTTGEGPEELKHLEQQGLVDGFLLMEVNLYDPRIAVLRRMRSIFSMIGRCEDSVGLTFVDINFEQTVRQAFDHLRALGHETIAFLNQSRQEFELGYGPVVRSALAFETISINEGNKGEAMLCSTSPHAGYEACKKILNQEPRPTALIVMNDRAVPGVLKALGDRGIRIPEDFSVVSIVSSTRASEMLATPLTCMAVPAPELGRVAVNQLIDMFEDNYLEPRGTLLPCVYVEGGSTAPRATQ